MQNCIFLARRGRQQGTISVLGEYYVLIVSPSHFLSPLLWAGMGLVIAKVRCGSQQFSPLEIPNSPIWWKDTHPAHYPRRQWSCPRGLSVPTCPHAARSLYGSVPCVPLLGECMKSWGILQILKHCTNVRVYYIIHSQFLRLCAEDAEMSKCPCFEESSPRDIFETM